MKDHHCKTYPYFIHATLTIQSHTPPPPLDKSVFSREENRLPRGKYDQLPSLAEIWPNYPPLPGTDGSRFLSIQLTEAIQTGQGKRSQVYAVRCTDSNDPLGLPTNHTIVAKFYDPTYYEIEYLSDKPLRRSRLRIFPRKRNLHPLFRNPRHIHPSLLRLLHLEDNKTL